MSIANIEQWEVCCNQKKYLYLHKYIIDAYYLIHIITDVDESLRG